MCFAKKVCQFARKVCRFAFQRPKRHREGLLGALRTPDNMSTSEAAFFIRRPVFVQKSPFARKDGRDCQKALPRGTTSREFSRPKMPETCLRSHGKGLWQTCVPRQIFLATPSCDATRHTKPKNSFNALYKNELDGENLSSDLRQTFV